MIPVALPDLDRLVEKVNAAKQWQDRASKLFVRKGYAKLLEVIGNMIISDIVISQIETKHLTALVKLCWECFMTSVTNPARQQSDQHFFEFSPRI